MTAVRTLGHCGNDDDLLVARLRTVLELATGISGEVTKVSVNEVSGDVYFAGANVRFSRDRIKTVERAAMWVDNDRLCLAMWPGELAAQYKRFYGTPKIIDDVIALCDRSDWELKPNFHLAFPHARPAYRWYPRRHCSATDYVRQWARDVQACRAGGRTLSAVVDPAFWQWLLERGYADEDDRAGFEAWTEKQPKRRPIHIRPGVQLLRSWGMSEALMLDSREELVPQVRQAIKEALTALGELGEEN